MGQSTYSWCGSKLHLVLEDGLAEAHNRAQDKFQIAQLTYRVNTGLDWTGREDLPMEWTSEEHTAWNAIADIINLLCKVNGGGLGIPEEDMISDHLIKVDTDSLDLVQTYYRSLSPAGNLWCESKSADEVIRESMHVGTTFQKSEIYQATTGWIPWDPTK